VGHISPVKRTACAQAERLRLCAILNKLLSGQKSSFFPDCVEAHPEDVYFEAFKWPAPHPASEAEPMGMKVVSQG
jgi:hypothetical protein